MLEKSKILYLYDFCNLFLIHDFNGVQGYYACARENRKLTVCHIFTSRTDFQYITKNNLPALVMIDHNFYATDVVPASYILCYSNKIIVDMEEYVIPDNYDISKNRTDISSEKLEKLIKNRFIKHYHTDKFTYKSLLEEL